MSKYWSPILYDDRDDVLDEDFDFLLDTLFDNIMNEIESDLRSVWSTNKSEQESQNASA